MSEVKCFMLREEPMETHLAVMTPRVTGLKCEANDICHRAEIPVDESTTFEDVRQRLLPVNCKYCGKFRFTLDNASLSMSHGTTVYVNPQTQKMSSHVREVATPGAMWYCPWLAECKGILSAEYWEDWAGERPPIAVMLPGGSEWVVDQCATGKKSGWRVKGAAPLLTASPSIVTPNYHGWLRNGVLTSV